MAPENVIERSSLDVDAGGRAIAATVMGAGEPLVLLEVGFGAESESWAAVAEGVGRLTRVCYYDRAGRGRSDPAARPRSAQDLLQDARRVVNAIVGEAPIIYVGQSFGGLMARLYAGKYPGQVAGVVLVDSMHEDQFDACAPHFPAPMEGEPAALTSMRDFWSGGWRDPSQNKEGIAMVGCLAAGHRVTSLGEIPLRILTAGTFLQPQRFPEAEGKKLQSVWDGLQSRFTRLSADSAREFHGDSGHFMQTDKPAAVIEAIAQLVKRPR